MNFRYLQIGVTLFVGAFIIYAAHHAKGVARDQQHVDVQNSATERLSLVAATLSQTVNVRLNHTRSLAAFVEANREFTQEEFERFATTLQRNLVGLRSLQLAPNGIVTYVTNLESNRAALGHDLFADENRRHLVEQSVRERKYIIAGPINLIQGGTAIIARLPLFLPITERGEEEFWGFATVLIDVEPLLAESGFFALEKDLTLAIRGKDALGAKGDTFYGKKKTFEAAIATAKIILPNGSWELGAALKQTPEYKGIFFSTWYAVAVGLIASIVCTAVYLIIEQPIKLRTAVNSATADLRKARDEEEKANQAKSEFLSMMSHELRTPLTSIKGSLGLLRALASDNLPGEGKELLDMAVRNSDAMLHLVNELLDYEKILSGSIVIETSTHNISALTSKVVNDSQGYAKTHSVDFVYMEPTEPAFANVQEHRFEQVLRNLLSNAAKFSEPGSTIEISLLKDKGTVSVRVKDNGPGILEEYRKEIFEQFSQIDSSSTREKAGTGLGLPISKALTEGMGGTLDFETEMGVGSTFYVSFADAGEYGED